MPTSDSKGRALLDWTRPSPDARFEVTFHRQGRTTFTWSGPAPDGDEALRQAKADLGTAWHVAAGISGCEGEMPGLDGAPEISEDTAATRGDEDCFILEPEFHAALANAGKACPTRDVQDDRTLGAIAQAALEAAAGHATLPRCKTLSALYGQVYDGPWSKVAMLTCEISFFGSEGTGDRIQGGLPRTDSLRATLVALAVLNHLGLKEFGAIAGEIEGMTSASVKAATEVRLRERTGENTDRVCGFLESLGLPEAADSFRKDFGP